MANKYPSVTSAARPRSVRPGLSKPATGASAAQKAAIALKAANDNKGIVRALGRIPKGLLRPSPASILEIGVEWYLDRKFNRAIAALNPPKPGAADYPPNAYWVEVCRTGPGGQLGNKSGNCGTLHAGPIPAWPATVSGTITSLGDFRQDVEFPNVYWKDARFAKAEGAPEPTPIAVPGSPLSPSPAGDDAPLVFPQEMPLAWPTPKAPPYSAPEVPNPASEPSAEPKPEPKPEPNKKGDVWVFPVVPGGFPFYAVPPPSRTPGRPVVPGTVITPGVGTSTPTVIRTPDFAVSAPPGSGDPDKPKVQEHKVRMRKQLAILHGVVWAGVNTVTEAMDFIQAMHDSIPEGGPCRLSSKASKAQVIEHMLTNFSCWGMVNPAEAVENYVNMQFGDMVAAVGSQQIKQLSQDMGIITGLDRAVNSGGKNVQKDPDAAPSDPWLPELDIDMERGVISVVSPLAGQGVEYNLNSNSLYWVRNRKKGKR